MATNTSAGGSSASAGLRGRDGERRRALGISSLLSSLLILAGATVLSACAREPQARIVSKATAAEPSVSTNGLPPALIHKSPSCGCCGLWVKHLEDSGFQVEVRNSDDVNPVKQRLGVPYGKGSCHTAEIGGYFVEGHVPAEDIKRLLAEKPDAKGLVLPGMPMGSPGMESPDGTSQPYTVELVQRDGTTNPFGQH
ncbi:MAG TPA: DUF411 domain-containing protein [Pseudoxanthomonas sp.]